LGMFSVLCPWGLLRPFFLWGVGVFGFLFANLIFKLTLILF
jgi:hypothetical protein